MTEFIMEEFKARAGIPPISNAASPSRSFFLGRSDLPRDRGSLLPSGTSMGHFRVESLNPSADIRRQASRSCGPVFSALSSSSSGVLARKLEGGVFDHRGPDPEINFGITVRRIGAGLENMGNTCFLNSVLQCLTYTQPFAAYLQSGKHKSSCHASGFCALCALQNHVMDALRSTGKILRPFHLVKNLRSISRNFRNARQEDAHEYMVNLLESMHKCCLPSGIASESPTAYEKSLVHKIFGGHLRSQVKCLQCSFCSNKFDPFLDLSLEINKADNLHKALSHFTAAEQLDGGGRQYQCQQCKQKVRAVKQLTIHKAPYVLTVHLKRFGTASLGQKIDKKIDFEPSLDLKRYVSGPNDGDLKYTLYGVLVHAGYATHSGHYYCFVRTSIGQWYSLNDHQVFQVSEKTVLQQKAYMLFYVRNMSSTNQKVKTSAIKENTRPVSSSNEIKHPTTSSSKNDPNFPQMEKQSGKNTCLSLEPVLLKGPETHPISKLSPTNGPSPSVSPLSSLTSEDLVAEGPTQKPLLRGSSIQLLAEDLMQTAQSKDKSASLTSTDRNLLNRKLNSGGENNLPVDSTKPLKTLVTEDGGSEMVLEVSLASSNKIQEAGVRQRRASLPDFKSMMFGPGRLIAYLSLSGKKKRRRIHSPSAHCKRKYGSSGSVDLGDLGPSTSAPVKMERGRRIPVKNRQRKETCNSSEGADPALVKTGLTSRKGSIKGSSDFSLKCEETSFSLPPVPLLNSRVSDGQKCIGSVLDKRRKEEENGGRRKKRRRFSGVITHGEPFRIKGDE